MDAKPTELPPRPPGVIKALLKGFNVVAGNIGVILLPVALDVFLWLGPRLTLNNLLTQAFKLFEQNQASAGQTTTLLKTMKDFAAGFNMFSNIRTYPLGVFSLMLFNLSAKSPLGIRMDVDISNWFLAIGIQIMIVAAGCFLGSLYFYVVSRVALRPEKGPGLLRALFHSLLLAGAWQFVFLMALPLALIFQLLSGSFLEILLFLLLIWPVTWLGLLVFFSSHAVFTASKNAFDSLGQTFRVLRYGMPPTGWFALMALIISRAMDLLWLSAPAESWMTVVGILGHAFVSTGLLAASFIFYRDLSTWVEEALQWLNTHQITSARA